MILAMGRAEGKGASESQTHGSTGPGLWKIHQEDYSALNPHSQKGHGAKPYMGNGDL